jgi:hypothetical protein
VNWGRLDQQITALGDVVGDGARHAADAAERARRSLASLDALERLLAADPPRLPERDRPPVDPPPVDAEPRAANSHRPQRASMHRSPLADLFRDTERVRRPD